MRKLLAISLSILLALLPVASAASVNILFNGQNVGSVPVSPTNLVSSTTTISHDPADITWSRVRVKIDVLSADPAVSPTRILLFKCKRQSPTDCVRSPPLSFERFIEGDLAWNDVSERSTTSTYPQVAQFLTLARLEDSAGKPRWVGLWTTVTRTSYNIFNTFSTDLRDIDVVAKSSDLVAPIKRFLKNFQMLPLNWLSSATFQDANQLVTIGGSDTELTAGTALQASRLSGNVVTSSSKDFLIALPQTSSGFANALTLTRNPSFTSGDGICDSDLGESQSNSCLDCGCPANNFCDTSTCKSSDFTLDTGDRRTLALSNCAQPFRIDLTGKIANAPSTLPPATNGVATINGTQYPVACTLQGDTYTCPVQLRPPVSCGSDSFAFAHNNLSISISYNDGRNRVFRTLSAGVPEIDVSYSCGCATGLFCDIGKKACSPESSMSLSVLSVTSYLSNFRTGDPVQLVARINNPASDLSVQQVTYSFGNITIPGVSSVPGYTGTVTCTSIGPSTYSCGLPLTIADYDHTRQYVVRANSIKFSVSYSDGTRTVTRDLASAFSDITIPSYRCGDGIANPEETSANCCIDVPCQGTDSYCDPALSCQPLSSIGLKVESTAPTEFRDCTIEHTTGITVQVVNPPTNLKLERPSFSVAGDTKPWPLTCAPAGLGLYTCSLRIPPQPCKPISESPTTTLGPNQISLLVSFPDGLKAATRTLSAAVPDLTLTPTFHPANGACETESGESAANSCVDCPCAADPAFGKGFFCDFDPEGNIAGTCVAKSDLKLNVLKPAGPVKLTTCEQDNTVNIQLEVKNAPTRLQLTGAQAIINGDAADLFFCEPQTFLNRTPGSFYNCSLVIPANFTCQRGKTIRYPAAQNNVTLAFQFPNGLRGFETAILTAGLPEISITQSVRSLYDIVQQRLKQVKSKLSETMKSARDLLKWQKTCVNVALVLAGVTISAMIVIPVVASSGGNVAAAGGGTVGGAVLGSVAGGPVGALIGGVLGGAGAALAFSGQSWGPHDPLQPKDMTNYQVLTEGDKKYLIPNGQEKTVDNAAYRVNADNTWEIAKPKPTSKLDWTQAATAMATVAQAIMNIWSKVCELISNQYQVTIQVQQMEIQFIQMQMCLDIAQHNMDTGLCNRPGQAQGCFNNMVQCVNFNQINSNLQTIKTYTAASATLIGDIGNQFPSLAQGVTQLVGTSGDSGAVVVECPIATDACCGFSRSVSTGGTTYEITNAVTKVSSGSGTTYTNFLPTKVSVKAVDVLGTCTGSGKQLWYSFKGQPQVTAISQIDATQVFPGTGDYTFVAYCGVPGVVGRSTKLGTQVLHYCEGDPNKGCYEIVNGKTQPIPACAGVFSGAVAPAAAGVAGSTLPITPAGRIDAALASIAAAKAKLQEKPLVDINTLGGVSTSLDEATASVTEAKNELANPAADIEKAKKSLGSAYESLKNAKETLNKVEGDVTLRGAAGAAIKDIEDAMNSASVAAAGLKPFDFTANFNPANPSIEQEVTITVTPIGGTPPYTLSVVCEQGANPQTAATSSTQALSAKCTYTTDGKKSVTVKASDANTKLPEKTLSVPVSITSASILSVGLAPKTTPTTTNNQVPLTATVTGGTAEPGGGPIRYKFVADCDIGTAGPTTTKISGPFDQVTGSHAEKSASSPSPSYTLPFFCTYGKDGDYVVEVQAQDQSGIFTAGHSNRDQAAISVKPPPPPVQGNRPPTISDITLSIIGTTSSNLKQPEKFKGDIHFDVDVEDPDGLTDIVSIKARVEPAEGDYKEIKTSTLRSNSKRFVYSWSATWPEKGKRQLYTFDAIAYDGAGAPREKKLTFELFGV